MKDTAIKKGKGFISEFKTFLMRGNVMELAVGVIIGAAFKAIVDSLVNNILMPVIGLLTGGMDFSNLFIVLKGDKTIKILADAKQAGAVTLNYGLLISSVINFVIIGFVVFVLVKSMNKLAEKTKKSEPEPESAPVSKECPYCKTVISIDATRCPNCTSQLQ